MTETPEARLARWTERDAALGAVAELEQVRARLAEREREVANLRERCVQLGLRVTELEIERNRLSARAAGSRSLLSRRVYLRVRRLGGRVLRRLRR